MILHKGDRVWFKGDKKPFRVRAANEKFAICTKPYNFQPKTVIYTIVDFEWGMRGMDNMMTKYVEMLAELSGIDKDSMECVIYEGGGTFYADGDIDKPFNVITGEDLWDFYKTVS